MPLCQRTRLRGSFKFVLLGLIILVLLLPSKKSKLERNTKQRIPFLAEITGERKQTTLRPDISPRPSKPPRLNVNGMADVNADGEADVDSHEVDISLPKQNKTEPVDIALASDKEADWRKGEPLLKKDNQSIAHLKSGSPADKPTGVRSPNRTAGAMGGHRGTELDARGRPAGGRCFRQIQIWTAHYFWSKGKGRNYSCPGLPCDVHMVENNNYDTMAQSDAVLFHYTTRWHWHKAARLKKPGQKWLFYSLECPLYPAAGPIVPPKQYADYYDYYMVYRLHERNIRGGFGYYDTSKPTYRGPPGKNWAQGKDLLAAWVAKNCNANSRVLHWKRTEFVRALSEKMQVNMYGQCGDQECPKYSPICKRLLARHKFYLAFENSACRDYITEKVWQQAYFHELVPVVYGPPREDYERVLPPNSFIHVEDFKTLTELAEYLMFLDTRDDLYNKYHEWRSQGRAVFTAEGALLGNLCRVLDQMLKDEEAEAAGTFVPAPPMDWDSWWLGACKNDTGFPLIMD